MPSTSSLRRFGVPAALLAVWLTFGSAHIGIKVGVASVPPFLFAGSRFVVGGTLLLTWSLYRAGGWPALSRRDVLSAAAVGAALILGGQGGVTWVSRP
jgi:drug/metabolite transporter (DMT)-like permease